MLLPGKREQDKTSSGAFASFKGIIILAAFFFYPVPGIKTADNQPDKQQGECPGIGTGPGFINPDSEGNADDRSDCNSPTDNPKHTDPEPDTAIAGAPGFNTPGGLTTNRSSQIFFTLFLFRVSQRRSPPMRVNRLKVSASRRDITVRAFFSFSLSTFSSFSTVSCN
jgi:hypothetical protein